MFKGVHVESETAGGLKLASNTARQPERRSSLACRVFHVGVHVNPFAMFSVGLANPKRPRCYHFALHNKRDNDVSAAKKIEAYRDISAWPRESWR